MPRVWTAWTRKSGAGVKMPKYLAASAIILNGDGRVLLVKHSYGRLHWAPPGGVAEDGESAAETAVREVREETGLEVVVERLVGVYFDREPDSHHFTFVCRQKNPGDEPRPIPPEITECGFFAMADLPRPINHFAVRRVEDGLKPSMGPQSLVEIGSRIWLD